MAADISFSFEVVGSGGLTLPVTISVPTPVSLGTDPVDVGFTLTNPLDRELTFASMSNTLTGAQASKLSVSLLSDSMVFAPGATESNSITITPNEMFVEGDSANIAIAGVE